MFKCDRCGKENLQQGASIDGSEILCIKCMNYRPWWKFWDDGL